MNTNGSIVLHSEYLSALLNSINASVIATNEQFIIEYCNKYAETIFGFTAEEVIGKKSTSVLPFTYLSDEGESARTKLIHEGGWQGRVIYEKQNGEEITFDAALSVVKNRSGKITGYVGVYRDITEYSKAKADLSTLLSTLSNIDDNFIVIDKEFRITFINDKSNESLRRYYGISYSMGDFVLKKIPSERRQQVTDSFIKALKGKKISYEVNIKDVTGKSVWLQGNYFPIRKNDGSISHACLIIREITSNKEIELVRERLYRSRKLFETFMENSSILSWIADAGGTIRYLNPAYLKIYHLEKQVIGKSVFEVFPQTVAQQIFENNDLVLKTRQTMKTIERGITPDEKEHIYQVVKFPVVSDEQTYVGGWAIDLTEEISLRENLNKSLNSLKQSEKELMEALEKEHHLNHLKSRFVSMASHEFRTPLSTILSSIFLLEKYTSTEQQAYRVKHIGKIKESIYQMNALLEDFLSLGKLDEGKTAVALSDFNLPDLVHEVIEEMETICRKGQTICFNSNEIKEIHSDKKLLRNTLINLLSNACKFSGENKSVWIKTEKISNKLRITIKDEGIGIGKEDKKHLFETFCRGANAQNIQGTGLGLHLVKRYTELLNGSVQLESEIDKGTTVTVLLPFD